LKPLLWFSMQGVIIFQMKH